MVSANTDVTTALKAIQEQLRSLDGKLERTWHQVEFLKGRLSTYLGSETALTYLQDETPIFLNSNDFGCPLNFLDGGRYEEENLRVLLSFVTDKTVFLDIGANLGFFSLQIANRLRNGGGQIHAFEPHPKIFDLFTRSLFLNGFGGYVTAHNYCLSNVSGPIDLHYPIGHIGGGQVASEAAEGGYVLVKSEMKRLDDVLGGEFSCDLVKIDVEGHELQVLEGMQKIVSRSPKVKVLLEKLAANSGIEDGLVAFFAAYGMSLYGVSGGSRLVGPLTIQEVKAWQGYFLAVKPEVLNGVYERDRFTVYPRQINIGGRATVTKIGDEVVQISCADDVVFHGPYWFLPKGTWKLTLNGSLDAAIHLDITERFGLKVLRMEMRPDHTECVFACDHDLVKFECVARPIEGRVNIALGALEFVRLG